MCAQPAKQPGVNPNPSGRRRKGRASKSIRKMAVLFTDVVGSSNYFKTYGDLAGREMLRQHQELASAPVTEHGGAVVKVLGDSVMAYFTDPNEALKAAVKIQQRFAGHNHGKDAGGQIHVRIGLHYGDGIVENGDIYGDVVNLTAKFLPMVRGDEIFITGQLQEQLFGLHWARFEKLTLKVTKDILKNLAIYRVSWNEKAELDPSLSSVLVLKPAWKMAKPGFEKAWKHLLRQKAGLWPGTPGQHAGLPDGGLVLFLRDLSAAPDMARNAIQFLRENLGRDGMPFLPLQILIDTGQFRKAGEPDLGLLEGTLSRVKPGEIHVSPKAHSSMRIPDGFKVIPPEEGGGGGLFRLIPGDSSCRDDGCLFLYQHSMGQGDHEPCFYCGDRRHLPADCPSKQLPDVTHGLERIGYHSLDRINEIYFEHLNEGSAPAAPGSDAEMARDAFFELRKVFQLRFLRTLWASNAQTWSKVEAGKDDGEKGGMIWIGQDCIRVSNLAQAETVLVDCLDRHPKDFHGLCAMGFLQVEKGDPGRGKRFFKLALENADSVPRQIFTRFLLSRIHDLMGEQRHAEAHVRKILIQESHCHEAQYLDMLYKFRKGSHADGIRRLRKLIDAHRRYFIAALIDPELAKYGEKIHPELRKLLDKARADADRLSARAAEGIEKMRRLLGEGEGELKRAVSYHEKIQDLSQTESYFGYLDIVYYATVIVQIAQRSSDHVQRKLLQVCGRLNERHERVERFVRQFPYGSLLGSLAEDTKALGKRVQDVREVVRTRALERFREALQQAKELSRAMARLEQRTRRLESLRRWIQFSANFTKKAFLMEGAVVLIALLLFPVVGHYLSFLIPGLTFSPENIWIYQKGVLIIGGLIGLFAAFLMSARDLGDA